MQIINNHFFFFIFSTDGPDPAFFLTSLTTPTPTVYFISLTANLPKGGKSLKVSITMALAGTILTIAASPFFINFGFSSIILPVF